MPQYQFPIFCYFCVSEVIHRKYSQNWTKQVPEVLFCPEASRDPKRQRRGATGRPHTRLAWPAPGSRHLGVRRPGATPDDAPSPIRSLGTENPRGVGNFLEIVPQLRRRRRQIFGGQKSLFRHLARTGKCPRSHLHRSPWPSPPSPSTSPPSPSTLLFPMMRRE
jgi:hypothetical protein